MLHNNFGKGDVKYLQTIKYNYKIQKDEKLLKNYSNKMGLKKIFNKNTKMMHSQLSL